MHDDISFRETHVQPDAPAQSRGETRSEFMIQHRGLVFSDEG